MKIPFASSPRSTLGLEWELMLVDKDSGDLRQAAQTILDALEPGDGTPHPNIRQELLLNTLEAVTGVCTTVPEAIADLNRSLDLVREITDPLRIALTSAGTHPFAKWNDQKITNKDRYSTLIERTQYWGRQMIIFGVHTHIGIEDRRKVMPIIRALLCYFPHLQSVSASSPYWGGHDTSYASNRALMFQQLPTAGLPFQFDEWSQYEGYIDGMIHTGVIDEINEIRWDIRPAPNFGTIELRVCDSVSNLEELAALAALCHCLVEYFSRELDAGRELPTMPSWFIQENKWRSARYGMDAIVILNDKGDEDDVTTSLVDLVERLRPVAEDLGCSDELNGITTIMERGAGYQRQQAIIKAGGSFEDIVQHLIAETDAGQPIIPTPRLNA